MAYVGAEPLQGFQLRYLYFIDKKCRELLTVPEIPFSKIDELGAGMYKGKLVTQHERHLKLSEEQIEKAERKVDMNAEELCE